MSAVADQDAVHVVRPGAVPRLYRTAGVAALAGALAYLVQPVLVFVVNPPTTGPNGYPVVRDLIAARGLAPVDVLMFATVGVATIVLAVAVHALRTTTGSLRSVPAMTGLALGVVAGLGWIGAAAASMAVYGLFATNLGEITDDIVMQQAAIQTALVGTGMLSIPVIGTAGWFAVLGTSGRRARIVGWPMAVVALLAAAVILVPAVVMLLPFGMLAVIPVYAALGVAFLVKSRRI